MNDTLFILGREPELSVAELNAVAKRWSGQVAWCSTEAALVRTPSEVPASEFAKLGGSVKMIRVMEQWPAGAQPIEVVRGKLDWAWLQQFWPEGRVEFGVSAYGFSNSQRGTLIAHLLGVKKDIRADKRPVRLVTSREPQHSAVTVQRNGLLKNGKEIVLVHHGDEIVVGVTVAVQDYQTYSLRDFGRPNADPKNGVVPPKLAQMMLNIAGANTSDILLDPFCGSGTILQEAALMGVKSLHGSDSEAKAVKDSQENLRWLAKEFPQLNIDLEITKMDARSTTVKPTMIVTEPYLGQPLRGHEPLQWLKKQAAELAKLYHETFYQWKRILRPGGRVVMLWPLFVSEQGNVQLELDAEVEKLGFVSQTLLTPEQAQVLKIENPKVLTYARDDARVRRQVRMWVA